MSWDNNYEYGNDYNNNNDNNNLDNILGEDNQQNDYSQNDYSQNEDSNLENFLSDDSNHRMIILIIHNMINKKKHKKPLKTVKKITSAL